MIFEDGLGLYLSFLEHILIFLAYIHVVVIPAERAPWGKEALFVASPFFWRKRAETAARSERVRDDLQRVRRAPVLVTHRCHRPPQPRAECAGRRRRSVALPEKVLAPRVPRWRGPLQIRAGAGAQQVLADPAADTSWRRRHRLDEQRRAHPVLVRLSGFCLSHLKVCDIVEDQVLYNLAKFGKTKMKT